MSPIKTFAAVPLVTPAAPTSGGLRIAYISGDMAYQTDERFLPGGAGYYRCVLPARALAAHGHHTVVVPHGASLATGELVPAVAETDSVNRYNLSSADLSAFDLSGYDVIVFQRHLSDPTAADRIRRARACGQVVIQDVDDWYHGIASSNEGGQGITADHRRGYLEQMRASTAITVSTPFLADQYRKLAPGVPVHLLRNAIDLERWPSPEARKQGFRQRGHDHLIVGWVGATPWRSGDLETIAGWFGDWLDSHDALFAHGGYVDPRPLTFVESSTAPPWRREMTVTYSDGTRGTLEVPPGHAVLQPRSTAPHLLGLRAEQVAWQADMVPVDLYPRLLVGFDVGIVPLSRIDFNAGKSVVKFQEYLAAGVPAVAQDLPEYRWLQSQIPESRFLAHNPKQWQSRLAALADPDARAAFVANARPALERMSMAQRWKDWESVYSRYVPAQSGNPPLKGLSLRN